jgi:hypothetical protein
VQFRDEAGLGESPGGLNRRCSHAERVGNAWGNA